MKTKFSMQRAKILATQLAWEFIGSVFIAAGIYNFAVQAKFPMTGFSGISIILYRLLNIPIGFSTILLNIPLAIICYRLLGRKFFISSLRCMVISSLMIDYVAPLFPVYEGDRLLAALCTGVFGGIGYALIYSKNSSTGGSDFIIMAVKAIKPHLSLGKIAFWSDVGIILVGGILFRDIDGIIYGMVVNFIFAVAVDKLMYGINAGKLTLLHHIQLNPGIFNNTFPFISDSFVCNDSVDTCKGRYKCRANESEFTGISQKNSGQRRTHGRFFCQNFIVMSAGNPQGFMDS